MYSIRIVQFANCTLFPYNNIGNNYSSEVMSLRYPDFYQISRVSNLYQLPKTIVFACQYFQDSCSIRNNNNNSITTFIIKNYFTIFKILISKEVV